MQCYVIVRCSYILNLPLNPGYEELEKSKRKMKKLLNFLVENNIMKSSKCDWKQNTFFLLNWFSVVSLENMLYASTSVRLFEWNYNKNVLLRTIKKHHWCFDELVYQNILILLFSFKRFSSLLNFIIFRCFKIHFVSGEVWIRTFFLIIFSIRSFLMLVVFIANHW